MGFPSHGAAGGAQPPALQPPEFMPAGLVQWRAGWGEERAGQRGLGEGKECCGGGRGRCFTWEVESKWETGNHESLAN